MKKYFFILFLLLFTPVTFLYAASPILKIFPDKIIQGEPLKITIENVSNISDISSLTFDGKPINVFLYQQKLTAFIGISLNKKAGVYSLVLEMKEGVKIQKAITVEKREKYEVPLGIPASLGGNTPAAQSTLVKTLAKENAEISTVFTGKKVFWKEKFRFPLQALFITDPYGYDRSTGAYSIAHKGTDFRATIGTPVMAMNRGVVRVAKKYIDYGNTIIVDHGLGLMTMYMHLSKINVIVGELVLPGEVIGLSGKTGYAEGPHLHISVRLNGTSIDPMKFMDFFK